MQFSCLRPHPNLRPARAFSLIEAVVGMALLGIVSVSLLGAVITSSRIAEDALRRQSAEVFAYGVLEGFLIETINDLSAADISVRLPGEATNRTFTAVNTATPGWVTANFELRQRPGMPVDRVPIALNLRVINNSALATRPHLRLQLSYRWPRATLSGIPTNQTQWLFSDAFVVRSLVPSNAD